MAHKRASTKRTANKRAAAPAIPAGRPSALLDTRIVYCGDCLDQLRKLPDGCVDLIYIDPPFNSNRNYEVFWGDLSETRPSGSGFEAPFDDRHASHYIKVVLDEIRLRALDLRRHSPLQCGSSSSQSRRER